MEGLEVGANDAKPNFQRVPEQLSEENPSVEPQLQSPQSSEPQLLPSRRRITTQQFERDVRARQSTSSVPPDPSSEAALAFQCEKLGTCLCVEEPMEKGWC